MDDDPRKLRRVVLPAPHHNGLLFLHAAARGTFVVHPALVGRCLLLVKTHFLRDRPVLGTPFVDRFPVCVKPGGHRKRLRSGSRQLFVKL